MESTKTIGLNPQNELNRPRVLSMEWIWNAGLVLLVASTMLVVLSRTVADPDLWGHLRFGLDILESGSIPRQDPYSYISAGQTWINHEWLSEVLFGLTWKAGGVTSLVLLKVFVGFLTVGIVFRLMNSARVQPLRAAILLLISIFLLMPTTGTVRPHMFTTLSFALTLVLIYQAESGRYRWLWAGPAVFALWVNLHGGFLAGIGILGLWTLFHLPKHYRMWRSYLPPVILSAAATLLNPYGIDLLLFLFRTATVPRPEITEWEALRLTTITGAAYVLLLALSIAGLIYSRLPRKPALILLFAVTALLPFVAVRHVTLFGLAALVLTGEHIGDAWARFRNRQKGSLQPPAWLAGLPALVALGFIVYTSPRLTRIPVSEETYPVNAVSLIQRSGVSGNLANMFNWGEYVLWHLEPQVKILMDGRRETVYPPELYKQYMQFQIGYADWDVLLEKYPAQMALVHKPIAPYNLLMLKPDWQLVYEDETSALFVQRGSPDAETLLQAAKGFKPRSGPYYFP